MLFVGLLALTGCTTETITESSFWQMLPFVNTKAKEEPPKTESPAPIPVVTVAPQPTALITTEVKLPVATPTPSPIETVTKTNPIKKSKRMPPSEPIGMPVEPSKKITQSALRDSTNVVVSGNASLITNPPATQPFRLSDWIYDEQLHDDWRAKQLNQAKEKEPIHEYEAAQLNRAFYNVILNEPSAEVKTEKPESKP